MITSPSLKTAENVSGISSVTSFIINNNTQYDYKHFELGRKDSEKRGLLWVIRLFSKSLSWFYIIIFKKINLIHFNLALSKASIIRDAPLILFAKLFRKKLVIHLHGGDYLTKEKIPAWMRKTLKKLLSGKSPVIVLSSLEAGLIKKKYNAKAVNILPNCVDLKDAELFNRDFEKEVPVNVLFIGRITADKGFNYIVEALKKLQQTQTSFTFTIAGTGPDEKLYVEKFSQMLGKDFNFKGVVFGDEKSNLFKMCNIFLLPSLFEGLPMSLLESMSYGMVPIVTPVGSMKDVVRNGENGIIVNINPEVEIAEAIEMLAQDRLLMEKLSKNAAEYIKENYDPENYIKELNRIYTAA